ncbi:mutanobactin A non-ribosomal peptide synthetase MubA [Streptococcus mutans]|nr:mutanobactin A non-ribosomal peptide synthetase MubA [Streptococcus mutans]
MEILFEQNETRNIEKITKKDPLLTQILFSSLIKMITFKRYGEIGFDTGIVMDSQKLVLLESENMDPQQTLKQIILEEREIILKNNQSFLRKNVTNDIFQRYIIDFRKKKASSINDEHSKNNVYLNFYYQLDMLNCSITNSENEENGLSEMFHLIKTVISELPQNINQKIKDIALITNEEKESILKISRGKELSIEAPTFLKLFQKVTDRLKNKVAISSDDWYLTYEQLNQESEKLSLYLSKLFEPKSIVPLVMDNSSEMFIVIFAILKSGFAFSPISLDYPPERIEHIIKETHLNSVIVPEEANLQISKEIKQYVAKDLLNKAPVEVDQFSNAVNVRGDDIAYVIFTSGTTGTPKGVKVSHQSLMNLITWHNDNFSITSETIAAKYAGVAFDASIWELFPYLSIGAKVYVVSEKDRFDVKKLNQKFIENKVSIAFLPTVVFEKFSKVQNPYLKILLTGAEKLHYFSEQAYEQYNNYGPTEYTVVATSFKLEKHMDNIPIGKPIANTTALVMSNDRHFLPIGFKGELYLGGDSLSSGYLNDSKKTKNSFIELEQIMGQVFYKTGDLVAYTDSGELLYYGRIDNQIKINGYRIELQDIEKNILEIIGQDSDCSVVVIPVSINGLISLHAFYEGVTGFDSNPNQVLKQLTNKLPSYMVPSTIESLSQFPLTSNGKVDRKYLEKIVLNKSTSVKEINNDNPLLVKVMKIITEILKGRQINPDEDFFQMGGNSLTAIELANKLQEELNKKVTIDDIFKFRNAINLVDNLTNRENLKPLETSIQSSEEISYESSPSQKAIFIEQKIDEKSLAYNMPIVYKINGEIDFEKLESSLDKVVKNNELLRSHFYLKDERVMVKTPKVKDYYHVMERKELSEKSFDLTKEFKKFVRPFNLEKDVLIRAKIIKTSSQKYLFLDSHHISFDGGSLNPFINDFKKAYAGVELERKASYSQYALQTLSPHFLKASHSHFEKEFGTLVEPLKLSDFGTIDHQKKAGVSFDSEFSYKIRNIALKNKVTVFNLLFSIVGYLLSCFSNQKDICIGVPVTNRNRSQYKNIIGMFVNTLPVRLNYENLHTVEEMNKYVNNQFIEALKYKEFSLEEIIKISRDKTENDISQLFNVLFVMNEIEDFNFSIDNTTFEKMSADNKDVKYDLLFEVLDNTKDNTFSISLEYDNKKYSNQLANRLLQSLQKILMEVVDKQKNNLSDIKIISEIEEQTLQSFLTWKQFTGKQQKLHEPFENLVKQFPNKIVVKDKNTSMTTTELMQKSNIVGNFLQRQGVNNNKKVAIIVNKSVNMMVTILGVLKSGAAYVPIEPSLPEERVKYILDDSCCDFIISEEPFYNGKINSETISNILNEEPDISKVESDSTYKDLCYIIYTSGSTGDPKGVMLTHEAVMNRLLWMQNAYPITKNDIILQKTSFGFDVSIWELFGWTFEGAVLYFLENGEEKDPQRIIELINSQNISKLHFVPSMLNVFLEFCERENKDSLKSLSIVFSSGEALTKEQVIKFYSIFDNDKPQLINLYGPTETAIEVTYFDCSNLDYKSEDVPIGEPLDNVEAYVLNDKKQKCPIGVVGELYIGGIQVAQGYINKEDATKKSFVRLPKISNSRLYATGDLVKWTSEGKLIFIGRSDDQVKIRGYRIELGEIEKYLKKVSQKNCLVSLQNKLSKNNKSLIAYIESSATIDESKIKEELKTLLPQYMVPSHIYIVPEFPINKSGKVDRKLLDSMYSSKHIAPKEGLIKSSNLTEDIKSVWSNILDYSIDSFSEDDNFFSLGGDSIKAISMASKLISKGYKVSVKEILKNPTIAQLTKIVVKSNQIEEDSELDNSVPLTPISQWFWKQNFQVRTHWNQAVVLVSKDKINDEFLRIAIEKIIDEHTILRSQLDNNSLSIDNQKDAQRFYDYQEIDICGWDDKAKIINSYVYNILSKSSKLINIVKFICDDCERIVLSIHHLLIDTISWKILIEDFCSYYGQLRNGQSLNSSFKTTSFITWANRINTLSVKFSESNMEKKYWDNIVQTPVDLINQDGVINPGSIKDRKHSRIKLEKEISSQLSDISVSNSHVTQEHILLTSVLMALKKSYSISNIPILMEGYGREEYLTQTTLARSIGWFTNTYPLVFKVKDDVLQTLIQVKDIINRVPHNGIGYGLLHLVNSNLQDLDPEISFNFLGEISSESSTQFMTLDNIELDCLINKSNSNPYLIEFSVFFLKGELFVDVYFDSTLISQEDVEIMNQNFVQTINELINCSEDISTMRSISDVTNETFKYESNNLPIVNDKNIDKIRKTLPMQSNILFLEQFQKNRNIYHEQFKVDFKGRLNKKIFDKAVQFVVDQYEALRTSFDLTTFGEPAQIIKQNNTISIDAYTFESPRQDSEAAVKKLENEFLDIPFDTQESDLFRITILEFKDQEVSLIFDYHHIILDGWSMLIVLRKIFTCYTKLLKDATYINEEENINIDDYFDYKDLFETESAKRYWKNFLENIGENLNLENYFDRNLEGKTIEHNIGEYRFSISKQQDKQIRQFCENLNCTTNDFAHLIWSTILYKYLKSQSQVFFYTVSGRDGDINIENEVGLFINTIPQVTNINDDSSISSIVESIHLNISNAFGYSQLPLSEILQQSQVSHDQINTLLVYENFPIHKDDFIAELSDSQLEFQTYKATEATTYDLTLIFSEEEEKISIRILYNPHKYSNQYISILGKNIQGIIDDLVTKNYFREITLPDNTFNEALQSVEDKLDFNF